MTIAEIIELENNRKTPDSFGFFDRGMNCIVDRKKYYGHIRSVNLRRQYAR